MYIFICLFGKKLKKYVSEKNNILHIKKKIVSFLIPYYIKIVDNQPNYSNKSLFMIILVTFI